MPVGRQRHFAARLVADALNEASRAYWLRRAAAFKLACPCDDDFHGDADLPTLIEAWERCMQIALACRRHADIAASTWVAP
jgi:hypothetical protein